MPAPRSAIQQLTASVAGELWPEWTGPHGPTPCDNPACTARGWYVRVYSILEFEAVYPERARQRSVAGYTGDELRAAGVAYICEHCGQKYRSMRPPLEDTTQ